LSTFREEVIGGFRFIEYKPLEMERPSVLLFSLPDAGLVSVISASHIVSTLGLEEVGDVEFPELAHIAVVREGLPRSPLRIYAGRSLAAVFTDVAISPAAQVMLASAVVDYARLRGVDYVVSLSGIPSPNRLDLEELKTYYVSSNRRMAEVAEKGGAVTLKQGVLVGAYAALIRESVRKGFNSLLLLTECFMEFPDPEAAARGLQVFSRITNINIDTKKLLEEAELIKVKTRELMRQTTGVMKQMRKDMEYSPFLYA
jgi:uncharacterized protein